MDSLFARCGEAVYILRPSVGYDDGMDEVPALSAERVEDVLFGTPTAADISDADRAHAYSQGCRMCLPKGYGAPVAGCWVVRERDMGDGADPCEAQPRWAVVTDAPALPEGLCPTRWNRECTVEVQHG